MKKNTFKRVLAGSLALLTVAAYTPANVGDLIQVKGNVIVANAADTTYVEWYGNGVQAQVRDYITSISDGTTTKTADEIAKGRGFDFEKNKILTIVSSIPLTFSIAGYSNPNTTLGSKASEIAEGKSITEQLGSGEYANKNVYALTVKDGVYTYQIVNTADITIEGTPVTVNVYNKNVTTGTIKLTDNTDVTVTKVTGVSPELNNNQITFDGSGDSTNISTAVLENGNAVFTSTKAFEVIQNLITGSVQKSTRHVATYDAETGKFVVTVTKVSSVDSDGTAYTSVNFYLNKVTPDYAFALSNDGTKLNATLNNTTSTAASITAKYQAKVKAAQGEAGSNIDSSNYKYDTVTDLATGGSVPNASRVALTFTNDASGEVTTASSGDAYHYTLKITKDGTELADTATVMKVAEATPAAQASSTSTAGYSSLKNSSINFVPDAATGTNTLYFTEAGKYKVEYTVFVKKQEKDSSGNVTSTTVEAKTMSYEFTIENKAPLTAANVRLTATATNADAATKPVLNGSTVSGSTETISKVGIVNGVVEIEVTDNWKNNPITLTGVLYPEASDAAAGSGTPLTIKSFTNNTSASTLNTVQTIYVNYNHPDYGSNDQTIVVQYKLVEAKKAATVKANEAADEAVQAKWNNKGTTSNQPFLTTTVDTLDTLEEEIWEAIEVENADANDVVFEYKKGYGANVATEELDWREDGLPTEAGQYSVFITLDGEVLDTFNLEVAKHALYAAPTAAQLSVTYGDEVFKELAYVDANGETISDANVKKPSITYVKAYKLNASQKRKITADNKITFASATTVDGQSVTASTYSVYDVNGEKYIPFGSSVNLNTGVIKAGHLDAGVYVATIGATSGTTTVGKEGYSLLEKSFALTVAKKQITSDMIVIAPQTKKPSGAAINLTSSMITVKDTLANGDEVDIPVTVAGGKTSESKVNSVDSNGKAIPYEVQLQVTTTSNQGMNYTGTATGNWYITEPGVAMNSIKFTDANTTILDNGKIRFEVTRPADSQFSNGVADFGVVICKDGKLKAPKKNGTTPTVNYPANKYPKTGNVSNTATFPYIYANDSANTGFQAKDEFEAASAALMIGNGYIEGHQPASWTGAKTTYGANVEVKDAETGVWIVGYVKDKKGQFFYGAPVYLNLVQEATELMQLTLADVPDDVSGASADDYNYVNINSKEDAKENQSATALEKKTWRKSVRNGYSEDKAKYYVYGSYTIPEDGKVKPTAGKGFGIVVAKNGEFDANGNATDGSEKTVNEMLKLGKGFIEGKRQANSTTMDEDEYGAYITPADTVTGVWYVGYLALGNGLEVYTDPVYIPPVSDIYTSMKPTVTLTANNTQLTATVTGTAAASLKSNATGKQVGVVVDKAGAFINKDASGDYEAYWAVNPDDTTDNTYGQNKANSALLIGKGYLQGKKTAAANANYTANLTPSTYAHSGTNANTNIPVVVRPYRVYTIKGNDVTIYGDAVGSSLSGGTAAAVGSKSSS